MSLFRRRQSPSPGPAILFLLDRTGTDDAVRDAIQLADAVRAAGWRAHAAGGDGRMDRELRTGTSAQAGLRLDPPGPWRRSRAARALTAFVRRERIDVVHALTAPMAELAVLAAGGHPAALVTTIGDDEATLTPAVLEASARIVVRSEFAAETVTQVPGLEAAKLRLVRPWIDTARFDPDAVRGHRVAALAERLAIPAGPRIIVVPDCLATDRGHEVVIAAVRRLVTQDFILLFLGGAEPAGDAMGLLHRDLAAAGLDDRARFGRLDDDLPAALTLGDLVLYPPTRAPGSTRLIAAAQAMGRPVIVSASGALAETLMPAATGWLVPPDDPAAIAEAVDRAFSLPTATRERVARRARAFAVERFAAATGIGRQIDVYRELLRRDTDPPGVAAAPATTADA